jgi:hypothetical protein
MPANVVDREVSIGNLVDELTRIGTEAEWRGSPLILLSQNEAAKAPRVMENEKTQQLPYARS